MPNQRRIIRGKTLSPGIVLGRSRVVIPGETEVLEIPIPQSRVAGEIKALDEAVALTTNDLTRLRKLSGRRVGGPVAKIFEAQLLVANDADFLRQVKEQIKTKRRNAAFIYHELLQQATAPLRKSDDKYMRHMVMDIEAVGNKVMSYLAGTDTAVPKIPAHSILVGRTFTPNDIVSYRQRRVAGFIVGDAGEDSHMALVARALLIPVIVVRGEWEKIHNNARIVLDCSTGAVVVNPTEADWTEYRLRKRRLGPAAATKLRRLRQIPPETADGRPITIAANLTLPGPTDEVLAEKNIPIGLYRTEFLYLSHSGFPDEEVQYQYYAQVAERFAGTTVVLRTFDLGYDKIMTHDDRESETNPALGWRGIRPMLEMTDLFTAQIRAILRASTRRNLKILLPMITDLSELRRAKKLIARVKFQLRKSRIAYDENIPIGIMIEVPAAAIQAEKLADEADFMSIGTNDLTQYTLAADRSNYKVADLYCPYHPAVLELIARTVAAGRKKKKPISICGEMAGDILGLPLFIGLGVEMLSMGPGRIFEVSRTLSRIDASLLEPLVRSVLASGSVSDAVGKLQKYHQALKGN